MVGAIHTTDGATQVMVGVIILLTMEEAGVDIILPIIQVTHHIQFIRDMTTPMVKEGQLIRMLHVEEVVDLAQVQWPLQIQEQIAVQAVPEPKKQLLVEELQELLEEIPNRQRITHEYYLKKEDPQLPEQTDRELQQEVHRPHRAEMPKQQHEEALNLQQIEVQKEAK